MPKVTIYEGKNSQYVRIKPKNTPSRLYVIANDGEINLYDKDKFNENRRGKMIEWEDLPLTIRKFDFKQVFPKGASHNQYLNHVYGKDAKRILKFEAWLNSQRYIPKPLAWKVYEKIGIFDRPKLIANTKHTKVYLFNNKWYVTWHKQTQETVFQSKLEHSFNVNNRLKKISRKTGIPVEVVSIIKLIPDDQKAIQVLNQIINLYNEEDCKRSFKKYFDYLSNNKIQEAKSEYLFLKSRIERTIGKKNTTQIDLSKSKFKRLTNYLINNS